MTRRPARKSRPSAKKPSIPTGMSTGMERPSLQTNTERMKPVNIGLGGVGLNSLGTYTIHKYNKNGRIYYGVGNRILTQKEWDTFKAYSTAIASSSRLESEKRDLIAKTLSQTGTPQSSASQSTPNDTYVIKVNNTMGTSQSSPMTKQEAERIVKENKASDKRFNEKQYVKADGSPDRITNEYTIEKQPQTKYYVYDRKTVMEKGLDKGLLRVYDDKRSADVFTNDNPDAYIVKEAQTENRSVPSDKEQSSASQLKKGDTVSYRNKFSGEVSTGVVTDVQTKNRIAPTYTVAFKNNERVMTGDELTKTSASQSTPKLIRYKKISDDIWGRKRIQNVDTKSIYADVDGTWNTTTKDGEPLAPIRSDIVFQEVISPKTTAQKVSDTKPSVAEQTAQAVRLRDTKNELDAQFLTGQISQSEYDKKNIALRTEFETLYKDVKGVKPQFQVDREQKQKEIREEVEKTKDSLLDYKVDSYTDSTGRVTYRVKDDKGTVVNSFNTQKEAQEYARERDIEKRILNREQNPPPLNKTQREKIERINRQASQEIDTDSVRELEVFAIDNNRRTSDMLERNLANLDSKKYRGEFNPDAVVLAMRNVTDVGSDEYKREFGYGFSPSVRSKLAVQLANDYNSGKLEDRYTPPPVPKKIRKEFTA